jgi:hypothetical protein
VTLHELRLLIDTGLLAVAGLVLVSFVVNALVDWLGLDKYLGINQ